ncbi:RNA polymerase B [Clydaea vesicula]|uniref:RNA polymerase B n=1 Tax=Clydaea vesicula TaxID=447962 RepID=A0AAD5U6B1_9FUNG|nr:RNA polymerase B [Clydaea vesicula]KAJ3393918.1 RNA polymerase B [Lobulomyces angularis]
MMNRRKEVVEEDASKNLFSPEFTNVQCLLISEVRVLLQAKKENIKKEGGQKNVAEIIQKTIDYCDKFSKFQNKNTVKEVRQLFDPRDDEERRVDLHFNQFEVAQLANLCCETTEEAKILIPSLAEKDDDQLQNKLTEMQNLKKYGN